MKQQINSFIQTRHAPSLSAFRPHLHQRSAYSLTAVLPAAISSSASPVFHLVTGASSQSASQTSCAVIACQSCLHACFFFFLSAAAYLTRNTYLHTKMKLQAIWEGASWAAIEPSMNSAHPCLGAKWRWMEQSAMRSSIGLLTIHLLHNSSATPSLFLKPLFKS